jgi:hypothetical protein
VLVGLGVRGARPGRRELDVAVLHAGEEFLVVIVVVVGALIRALRGRSRVAVRQLAAQDVAEDLGVAVRVRGEAGLGCDAVFVQDADGAEVREGG